MECDSYSAMAGDIEKLLDVYKIQISEDLKRLKLLENKAEQEVTLCDSDKHQQSVRQSGDDKENFLPANQKSSTKTQKQDLQLVDHHVVKNNSKEGTLTKIFATCAAESPDGKGGGRSMLRYGEFSPNNPELLRVPAAAPYLGLGEYDSRRNILLQKRRNDYLEYLSKYNSYTPQNGLDNPYGLQYNINSDDQQLRIAQDALLKSEMDKPKSILSNRRTASPRSDLRALNDVQNSYTPSFLDGFSYRERSEELERERLKRENYERELRLQIEEKRRLQAIRDDQDRREQELENKRFQHQLLRMQEEQAVEEQRKSHRDEQMRRHSDDLLRRKYELNSRFHKHGDSESSVANVRNTAVASKTLSHYSPPVSRRNPYSYNTCPSSSGFGGADIAGNYNPNLYDSHHRKNTLNRMDSLNIYDSHPRRFNAFTRYDSLGRIDALSRQDIMNRLESLNNRDSLSNVQRRHSATQQDLSLLRYSPKLQRRNSASRFDDTLPMPVLKAHSPVAKELKNSVPFKSSRSDSFRQFEDKWQIPTVQKNIVNDGSPRDGSRRNILSHLGAIRMQLQQEQLRMDETLRNRDIIQSKAVDFH